MGGVPHHLLDVISPIETYSVAQFQNDGRHAISEILKKKSIPFIVGGTGFYVDALLFDMQFPSVAPNTLIRNMLADLSTDELFAKLQLIDPRRSNGIDAKNRVRLVRALEIAMTQGPVLPVITTSKYDICWIGITTDTATLRERISKRLSKRIDQGMISEFTKLHANGLSYLRMEALGLEYRYGARLLQGLITKEEFERVLTNEIAKYAKRQMTWFKRNTQINWFEIGKLDEVPKLVEQFLKKGL